MGNPFKPAGGIEPEFPTYQGVDCYGGTNNNEQTNKLGGDFEGDAAENLPKGVNKYGATEDLGDQGEAAIKYGTASKPGMS